MNESNPQRTEKLETGIRYPPQKNHVPFSKEAFQNENKLHPWNRTWIPNKETFGIYVKFMVSSLPTTIICQPGDLSRTSCPPLTRQTPRRDRHCAGRDASSARFSRREDNKREPKGRFGIPSRERSHIPPIGKGKSTNRTSSSKLRFDGKPPKKRPFQCGMSWVIPFL